MMYATMTSLATAFWSFVCFCLFIVGDAGSGYCWGGAIPLWFGGLVIIMMYRPIIKFISMDSDEWKSFLLAIVAVVIVVLAIWFMLHYTVG